MKLYIPIILSSALLGLVACNASQAATGSDASTSSRVETVVANAGVVQPTLSISGILAPYSEIGVSAAFNERILEIRVREGDRVKKGDVLAVLDADELRASLAAAEQTAAENRSRYEQQLYQSSLNAAQYSSNVKVGRAALAQAEASLEEAQINFHRYEMLYRSGYLSAQTLESQRVTVAADTQAVSAAQAQYDLAVANAKWGGGQKSAGIEYSQILAVRAAVSAADAAVSQIRMQIGKALLTAPVDGVVSSANANPAEYPSGRQLFTIHNDSQMYAMLAASANQAMHLRSGDLVSVVSTDESIQSKGVVEAVLDQLSPGTTNFIVKVRVANPNHAWRAGVPVTAHIALSPVRGTVVPNSAFADSMGSAVLVVRNGVAKSKTVRSVASDGSHVVVEGIAPGTALVRDGQSGVADGDKVTR